MKKQSLAMLLLALVALTPACSSKPSSRPPTLAPAAWTAPGGLETGGQLYRRVMDRVVVHYRPPTLPDAAELTATAALHFLRDQGRSGWVSPAEPVHIWLVPGDSRWPDGLPMPPVSRFVRAADRLNVVLRDSIVDTSPLGAPKDSAEANYPSLFRAGLGEALALAVTEPAGSPVFQVDWLHEGMGSVLVRSWIPGQFPDRIWDPLLFGGGSRNTLVEALEPNADVPQFRSHAPALAALLVDRFGSNWSSLYSRRPEDLTPQKAAEWATGATGEAAELIWWERMRTFARSGYLALSEVNPDRVQPVKVQPRGPGAGANLSEQVYRIDARYEPERRSVTGTATLTWTNGEGVGIDTLYFHLWPNAESYAREGGGMTVESVSVGGAAAAFEARGLDLVVPLGRTAEPGARAEVQVTFTTRLPASLSSRLLGQSDSGRSDSGRFALVHWYPALAALDDKGWHLPASKGYPGEPYAEAAAFQVSLDVPWGTLVGGTGRQVSRRESGDRWLYAFEAPQSRGWAAAGGTGLKEYLQPAGDVTIRVLDTSTLRSRSAAAMAEQALVFYQKQFGPYPYPELTVLPCCATLWAPGLVFTGDVQGQDALKPPVDHGLAHQWFGNLVGSDTATDVWMDEGFTAYAVARYTGEGLGAGQPVFKDEIAAYRGHPSIAMVGYTRLQTLEQALGTPAFDRLLRTYVQEYRFRTATPAELIRLAEATAGRQLGHLLKTGD